MTSIETRRSDTGQRLRLTLSGNAALAAVAAFPMRGGGGHSGSSGGSSGGSHSFSGGGSRSSFSSGGYSSSSSGGGGGFLGIIIIVIIIIALVWFFGRKGGSSSGADTGGSYSSPPPPPPQVDPAQALAALTASDPDFSYDDFMARANRVFFIVQNAWMNLNADEGRAFMTDGIYQQWKMQLEGYKTANKRNMLEDLAVLNITPLNSSHTDELSSVTVRMRACCADYDVDMATNKIIRGDRTVNTWQEDWTFVRDGKVTSKVAAGIKNCPNCGAPFDGDLEGRCRFCKTPVIGGLSDWVLQRIDQVAN